MTAGFRGIPDADALARIAEAFVLAWSSMPPELPEKISASQLRALVAVQRSGVTTVTALARDLGALPSSATRLCDRLVAAGYLDRTPDAANRRFHAVRLTPAGERLLAVLQAHRRDAIAAVTARMHPEAVEHLVAGLTAFAAEAGAPGDAPDTAGPAPGPRGLPRISSRGTGRPQVARRGLPEASPAPSGDDPGADDGPTAPRASLG